ncbi:MAG: hypothetical protein QG635_2237 [Bacteroidota bacterium]|nr:hypothetical protein [Bacteroidota bacterium]
MEIKINNYLAPLIIVIILLLSIFPVSIIKSQEDVQAIDSLIAPKIELIPVKYLAAKTSGKFAMATVKALNRGGTTLRISSVKGSCECASARVYTPLVDPLEIGKIEFAVNLDGIVEGTTGVEYVIMLNASNSPSSFRLELSPEILDSIAKARREVEK